MKKHIPNILTGYRIAVIPVLVGVALGESWMTFVFLILIGFGTDILDGYLARRWNIESSFGKDFDTNADKAFVIAILGIFTIRHDFPILFFLIIAFREVMIGLARSAQYVPGVAMYGKAKMWFQCVLTLLLPLAKLGYVPANILGVASFITALVTFVTGVLYLIPNKKAPR